MTTARVVIGLDVGTTAVKAGLYDVGGGEVAVAAREHPLHTPAPGHVEQDPAEVADAVLDVLGEVATAARDRGTTPAGVCVGTAMHGLVGFDAQDAPCTPVLTWADTRAAAQADALRADHPDVYHRTGTPLHPMSPLAKLVWYREQGRDAAGGVHRWGTLKEVVLAALTGTVAIDTSSASATGLLDLRGGGWDGGALDLAGIDAERLAPLVASGHVLDGLTTAAADRTGLDRATPVVVGATDGALANLGVGAVPGGPGAVSIGTSGAVRVTVDAPDTDARMRTFCYVADAGRWVVGGAISNGGLWLRWLRDDVLGGRLDDEELSALAGDVPPGCDGVTVLPYLTGERAPQWSTAASGVVFGLRSSHGHAHLARAGMEGVAHQLRLVTAALADDGHDVERLRATGGFTRSDVWVRTVADVLGVPLEVPDVSEAAARGAAVLGMGALELVDDVEETAADVAIAAVHEPDPGRQEVHDAAHERYVALVDALTPLFGRDADSA